MKSVKPGRGPSFMSGIASIVAIIFGIFWMIFAASAGAGFFSLFGLLFIAIAVFNAVYHFKNATSENRYSEYDIVDNTEEIDPLNKRYGSHSNTYDSEHGQNVFCPYCGAKAADDFEFCPKCGRKLPR